MAFDLSTAKPVGGDFQAATAQTIQTEVVPPQPDIADVTPFRAQREETRAAKELPELGSAGLLSGESGVKIAAIAPLILTTTKPEEIAGILTQNFPNIGITQDPGGNLIANNNKTGAKAIINKPGISKLDILQILGIGAAFTSPAQLASIPAKLGAKALAGGAGAAGLQSVIEGAQELTGGQFDPGEVALAGGLGGAAEFVGPAIAGVRNLRQSRALGAAGEEIADVSRSVAEAGEITAETGIPLFQAQQTLVPATLEKQAFLSQLPASTQKASSALKQQNEAAGNAVERFLAQIAPEESVITGAERVRTAAQGAIEKTKLIRKEKTSPLFEQAFEEAPVVDLTNVKSTITNILDDFPSGGEVDKSLSRVSRLIRPKKGVEPSLRVLQGAKLEIDQMINKFGADSLGNTTKRQLLEVKSSLLAQMDEASPLFKAARETFEAQSPSVTKIQESIIGKIANVDDTQLKSIARTIFDPAETNPAIIKNAKRIISDIDPDAWNQILRSELERRIGSVTADIGAPGATLENIPGQLSRAIFGNKKQRDVLFNAVDGDTKKNLLFLEAGLKRAKLGRPGGSQTAAREEIKKELRGGVGAAIRDIFRQPINTLVSTGDDAAFNARTRSLAEAIFDPQWSAQLKEIRKFSPESPAAGRAMAQLLNQINSTTEK